MVIDDDFYHIFDTSIIDKIAESVCIAEKMME